ncbi:hypothetical protein CN071_27805 [Sinorhizobium meliloti]|nr:hypothetical protein CN071_27805 [Sinorhizobium meliloti]
MHIAIDPLGALGNRRQQPLNLGHVAGDVLQIVINHSEPFRSSEAIVPAVLRTCQRHAPNDARIGIFRVADQAGFMDGFMRKADVGCGRNFRLGSFVASALLNLSPVLRGVVFIRELLKQIEAARGGDRKSSEYQREGDRPLISRTAAAEDAGLSEHQRKTMLRVANGARRNARGAHRPPL